MTNIRDAWQSDMQAHADATRFTATVTAYTAGQGVVSFKRYPDASAETQPKLASYTSPQVGDVVMVEALGSGWVVVGRVTPIYQPLPYVTSLPTASATYQGVMLRVPGGAGVADTAWICEKNAAGGYAWVAVDSVAPTGYGIVGTATNGSNQTGITTDTAITGMSITVSSPPSGYLRAIITLRLQDQVAGGGNGAWCRVTLKQGGTAIASFDAAFPAGMAVNQYQTFSWLYAFTPSAATYTLSVQSLSGGTTKCFSGGLFAIEAVPA